ncbi:MULTISPECIES: hypothetical protein [Rhodobacterales]|uniref:hypothetical protein n=1 Tax=Rhodobacterales TaxID=204455 RepID=UPI00237FD4DF|nr:hypothetical protein [Phaeobacter gallaeciensis]MEE2817953.1 hypothetical protein [Pseudomonadota bacterium]MDE4139966.1 hypothetical protein [Phaeobacter gallaeciensis]MDE4148424.1 hypothetical protein [Phaeobacter gallaeciensis]MDE4152632.1 hypothetical protein [Phaeobacter gallaeciensis]MDE4228034.1 hypothetical protein [Phaeobacter gallaeciensis]
MPAPLFAVLPSKANAHSNNLFKFKIKTSKKPPSSAYSPPQTRPYSILSCACPRSLTEGLAVTGGYAMKTPFKPPLVAHFICLTAFTLSLSTETAAAQDNVVSLRTEPANTLEVLVEPENTITLTISGNDNGGFGQSWPALPAFAAATIQPGVLSQTGFGNQIDLSVLGSDNLFAIAQNGSNNRAFGQITGTGNTALVMQTGHANVAVFHQHGNGNSVAISQSSW